MNVDGDIPSSLKVGYGVREHDLNVDALQIIGRGRIISSADKGKREILR